MTLTHKQARLRFEAAMDIAHYYGQKPELDPILAAHLKGCPECQAFIELAVKFNDQLAQSLPGVWQVPDDSNQRMEFAIKNVHNQIKRRYGLNHQNIKNGIQLTWQLGIELIIIALLLGVLILGLSLLPEKSNPAGSNRPVLTEPSLTPSNDSTSDTPVPQRSALALDGEWVADTLFGRLILSMGDAGEKIKKITYQFSNWTCGSITASGEIVDASSWLITGNEFSLTSTFDRNGQLHMELTGKYDDSSQEFSGNWSYSSKDTVCSGRWTASFLSPETKVSTQAPEPTFSIATQAPQYYIVQQGDTWGSIAGAFGIKVEVLKILNAEAGSNLFVGQSLLIKPVVKATQAPEEIPAGASVVNYFAWGANQDYEAVKAIAEKFNRSQSDFYVRVTGENEAFGFEGFGVEQVSEKFDCFSTGSTYADLIPVVHSLDALIETDPDGKVLREDIPESFWSAVRENGSIYGLPAASNPTVIYYNQNLVAEQGLEPPTLNWTTDDFWSLASAASSGGVYGFVPLEDYSFLFSTEGVELIDWTSDPLRVNFDNPKTLQVVRQLVEKVNNGVVPILDKGYASFSAGDSQRFYDFIKNGRAAMWTYSGGFPYGGYEDHGYPVGVAQLPMKNGTLNPENLIAIYISSHVVDPAGCWQWAKYLSSQAGAFLGIPVRKSVLNSPDLDHVIGAEAAATYRAVMQQPFVEIPSVEKQWQYPTHPLRTMWSKTLYSIFQGADPVAALAELQEKGEAYLSCITLANLREGDPSYFERVEECALNADPNYK
jgi:ABC-type glycerol-3-phosphate transport system substrate-binding protein